MGSLIMNTFYKISKEDANKVGSFEYEVGYGFNPFCSEQVDETYLVSIDLVEQLKDNENIKKIDWTQLEVIDETQIDNKYKSII
jgi:hypothetical protein